MPREFDCVVVGAGLAGAALAIGLARFGLKVAAVDGRKPVALAQAGDVIVVDAGGDLTNAIIGELMCGYAASRGIAGMVINGAIRDADILSKSDFQVYAAGVTHRGPYKDGPGQINVPVSLDGMVVRPGDIIVGDGDGVLRQ